MTNLSAVSTANSYIVNVNSLDSGGYFFPTFQAGNGKAVDWAGISYISSNGSLAYPIDGGARLSGDRAYVVSDPNSCVSDVVFTSNKIYFKATGREGNAKITLRNGGDTQWYNVWTWHIWCTDQPGTITIPSKVTANTSYAIMDRNMGAITRSIEGESQQEEMYGLYYTYGHYIGFTAAEYTAGATGGDRMVDSYAYNPDRPFVTAGGSYAPFNPWRLTDRAAPWRLLWGNGAQGKTNYKTMYDPCPPGYKVLSYDALSGYVTSMGSSPTSGLSGNAEYGIEIQGADSKKLFIPYNGKVYGAGEGYTKFDVTIWGQTHYNIPHHHWFVWLWTSGCYGIDSNSNIVSVCYSIQRAPANASNQTTNNCINGGLTTDLLTRGMGVRCMVGW